MLFPPNGSDDGGTLVVFMWGPSYWGRDYQLQVDDDADFSSPVWELETQQTQTFNNPFTTPEPGVYYWRVRVFSDDCGYWGSWSPPWIFLTAPADGPLVECPGSVAIPPFTTLESLPLDGFRITNTSAQSREYEYVLFTDGPAILSDNDDPSALAGITPLLACGGSFTPPAASLLIPEFHSDTVQSVAYYVYDPANPEFDDECVTTVTFDAPVATTVEAFEGRGLESGVEIHWRVHSDDGITGFTVCRRLSGEHPFVRLNEHLLPGSETVFIDHTAGPGASYDYRLGVVLAGGEVIESRIVTVHTATPKLALFQNQPNPFNPSTKIAFTLPGATHARLSIYNVDGKLVKTLVDELLDGGFRECFWNATGDDGAPVSSGVYFYRLHTNSGTLTKKMLLLR